MTQSKTVIPVNKSSKVIEGRNSLGRFTAGHRHSVGNKGGHPRQDLVHRFRELLYDMTRPEDIAEVWLACMIKAKKGNLSAARLIFQYTLGDPDKFIQVDYSGGVELVWDWDKVTLLPAEGQGSSSQVQVIEVDDNDK